MSSLLQRAGRCARFQKEIGEVRVYYDVEIEEINQELAKADTDDTEAELIQNQPEKKRKFLPYNDDVCNETWKVLEKHTNNNSGQSVGFATEDSWIQQVHQDESDLQKKRRQNNRLEFENKFRDAIFEGDRVFDWRVLGLNPHEITFEQYKKILDKLRVFNPAGGGHGIARFDAEIVIKMSIEFLEYYPFKGNEEEDIREYISGFFGTHFGSKGQVYGVKDIFRLNLPSWIKPEDEDDLINYFTVLEEHKIIIQSLSVDKGDTELLNAYRDFITGNKLEQFFPFQILYGDYIVKRLANSEVREPKLFSIGGLNLMVRSFQKKDEIELTKITDNPGFKNIAQAINSATVYAGKNDKGWERIYGLAQRLGSQTASKKDFIVELMAFLASYENENLRIDEELQRKNKTRRIWTTKEDLDSLIQLIEEYGSNLVGNLLIAYGYAKGWGSEVKKQKEAKSQTEKTESK